ncbi:hypothetical protein EDC40_103650 [Aminobacter aminovorans]|uniref:Uncharacterized protein n=1 Tax=Aminobacter aminovorans TaxID=83263 RepID=A0A380WMB1_AMIAI|nr:hypothetical protein [Aminobacter aminovorans]TCS28182.1 hypothetical protein EDC40_103650 [Aminobacter aminovorans]SUU89406.1 Uncharacterised protein [Aminobacter aminovorans]
MAAFDYGRMQGTATRLMERFKQGTVQLKRVTLGTPPNEWTPAPETVETWPLSATAERLHQRYENGVLIVETGDMVTFSVPEVEPQITDRLVIDGAERVITNLTPIPPAGTVVAFKAWCAA